MNISGILDKAAELLKGEPARAIGYVGGGAFYLVARALDVIPDVPLEQAILQTAGFIVTIAGFIETIRKFVYSAPTVERLVESAAATGDAAFPPPPADQP